MLNVLIDYSWNAFDQHQISFGLPRAAQHPSFIQLKIVVWSLVGLIYCGQKVSADAKRWVNDASTIHV